MCLWSPAQWILPINEYGAVEAVGVAAGPGLLAEGLGLGAQPGEEEAEGEEAEEGSTDLGDTEEEEEEEGSEEAGVEGDTDASGSEEGQHEGAAVEWVGGGEGDSSSGGGSSDGDPDGEDEGERGSSDESVESADGDEMAQVAAMAPGEGGLVAAAIQAAQLALGGGLAAAAQVAAAGGGGGGGGLGVYGGPLLSVSQGGPLASRVAARDRARSILGETTRMRTMSRVAAAAARLCAVPQAAEPGSPAGQPPQPEGTQPVTWTLPLNPVVRLLARERDSDETERAEALLTMLQRSYRRADARLRSADAACAAACSAVALWLEGARQDGQGGASPAEGAPCGASGTRRLQLLHELAQCAAHLAQPPPVRAAEEVWRPRARDGGGALPPGLVTALGRTPAADEAYEAAYLERVQQLGRAAAWLSDFSPAHWYGRRPARLPRARATRRTARHCCSWGAHRVWTLPAGLAAAVPTDCPVLLRPAQAAHRRRI